MEIRLRKKKTLRDRVFAAIIPSGGCVFVMFLVVLLYLHASLSTGGPASRTTTRSRSAEDAHHQLNNRQIYAKSGDDSDFRDPGAMDKNLTKIEKARIEKLRLQRTIETVDSTLPYDIHRCPPTIPKNYPYQWNILDVLKHWNPDETTIPDTVHQGLCSIDWSDRSQRKIALHYRKSEVPFLIKNHPVVWRTADRWSDYAYIHEKLGDDPYRNEHSTNNHMMYWKLRNKRKKPRGWVQPTDDARLTFPQWHEKARLLEDDPDSSPTAEHFYFRFSGGKGGSSSWLFDELTFFNPDTQNDIFMVDPDDARGINCRLGSRGTIAELHYDESRNVILIMHGQKRYILGHPDQCINLELHPQGHPSARHSKINWSDPDSWMHGGEHFRDAMVNEVVLEAGDALYLPTYWFHFIVSLNLNYQCNARSGISYEYQTHIRNCGFEY